MWWCSLASLASALTLTLAGWWVALSARADGTATTVHTTVNQVIMEIAPASSVVAPVVGSSEFWQAPQGTTRTQRPVIGGLGTRLCGKGILAVQCSLACFETFACRGLGCMSCHPDTRTPVGTAVLVTLQTDTGSQPKSRRQTPQGRYGPTGPGRCNHMQVCAHSSVAQTPAWSQSAIQRQLSTTATLTSSPMAQTDRYARSHPPAAITLATRGNAPFACQCEADIDTSLKLGHPSRRPRQRSRWSTAPGRPPYIPSPRRHLA